MALKAYSVVTVAVVAQLISWRKNSTSHAYGGSSLALTGPTPLHTFRDCS